jgi:hypothetical protein
MALALTMISKVSTNVLGIARSGEPFWFSTIYKQSKQLVVEKTPLPNNLMNTGGSEADVVLKRRKPFAVEPPSERLAYEKLHGD